MTRAPKPRPARAAIAAFQPHMDRLWDYIERENITRAEFCRRVTGIHESGSMSLLINGYRGPGPKLRDKLLQTTGLDFSDLPELRGVGWGSNHAARKPPKPAPRALAAVQAYRAESEPAEPVQPRRVPSPPRFAMQIHADGRASVTINLVDVPAAEALRLFTVLNSAGLIEPTGA